jgi:hypothetical protein
MWLAIHRLFATNAPAGPAADPLLSTGDSEGATVAGATPAGATAAGAAREIEDRLSPAPPFVAGESPSALIARRQEERTAASEDERLRCIIFDLTTLCAQCTASGAQNPATDWLRDSVRALGALSRELRDTWRFGVALPDDYVHSPPIWVAHLVSDSTKILTWLADDGGDACSVLTVSFPLEPTEPFEDAASYTATVLVGGTPSTNSKSCGDTLQKYGALCHPTRFLDAAALARRHEKLYKALDILTTVFLAVFVVIAGVLPPHLTADLGKIGAAFCTGTSLAGVIVILHARMGEFKLRCRNLSTLWHAAAEAAARQQPHAAKVRWRKAVLEGNSSNTCCRPSLFVTLLSCGRLTDHGPAMIV